MNTKMESLAKCPTLLLFDVCRSFPLPMRRYQARIHPEREIDLESQVKVPKRINLEAKVQELTT